MPRRTRGFSDGTWTNEFNAPPRRVAQYRVSPCIHFAVYGIQCKRVHSAEFISDTCNLLPFFGLVAFNAAARPVFERLYPRYPRGEYGVSLNRLISLDCTDRQCERTKGGQTKINTAYRRHRIAIAPVFASFPSFSSLRRYFSDTAPSPCSDFSFPSLKP